MSWSQYSPVCYEYHWMMAILLTYLLLCVGKLNAHMRVHRTSSVKKFNCTEDKCQKMLFSSEGLRRHKLTHLGICLPHIYVIYL